MTARDGLRDRWRAEVYRSPLISDSVRVVLLVLADHMTSRGYVSVPRTKLAAKLGRSPRRITERLEKARAAGFLDVVRNGRPGQTAEYVATFPDGADGRTNSDAAQDRLMVRFAATIHGADGRTNSDGSTWCGRGSRQYARVTNATRERHDHERNACVERHHARTERRSDEEATPDSPLAAILRKLDGRRPTCAGLRRLEAVAA